MATEIVVELQRPDQSWGEMLAVSEHHPLGSFSAEDINGIKYYLMFGWHHGEAGVWRSVRSLGENPDIRVLIDEGLEKLSDLREPYVTALPRPTFTATVRFRVQGS